MIRSRWVTADGLAVTIRPPFGSRANAVTARSISPGLLLCADPSRPRNRQTRAPVFRRSGRYLHRDSLSLFKMGALADTAPEDAASAPLLQSREWDAAELHAGTSGAGRHEL